MTAEALTDLDFPLFRKMYNGNGYGAPGPQSRLNRSLNEMTASELDTFGEELREFLWGDGPVEQRLMRALDREILNVKGLGESVLMKMLAVVHPDRFLPVFPLGGDMGKESMLAKLGLPTPAAGHPAARQVQANDQLRQVLEPHFPGDAWAQGQFGILDDPRRRRSCRRGGPSRRSGRAAPGAGRVPRRGPRAAAGA